MSELGLDEQKSDIRPASKGNAAMDAEAQDWNQWRGSTGNGGSVDANPPTKWSDLVQPPSPLTTW